MVANASLGAELRGRRRVCDDLMHTYACASGARSDAPVPLFGLPAESLNGIVDAIRKRDDVQLIGVRHEGSGALAAAAYAKLTGRIGFCMGTAGPGSTHLTSGAYDARADAVPLLVVSGQVRAANLGTRVFQEIDSPRLFSSVALYNQTVVDADAATVLRTAHVHALRGRGPVHLATPGDVMARASTSGFVRFDPQAMVTRPFTEKSVLLDAAGLLGAGPTVVLVGRVPASLTAEVEPLAARLDAPVLVLPEGVQYLRDAGEEPLRVTAATAPGARELLARAANVLLIGPVTASVAALLPNCPVVQVASAEEMGRPRRAGLIRLLGDQAETLRSLAGTVDGRHGNPLRPDAAGLVAGSADPAAAALWQQLDRGIPSSAVVALQPGALLDAAFQHLPVRDRTFISSYGFGARGYALPAGIAAALAHPDRPTVAIASEDGLVETMAELLTVRRYGLPVTTICVEGAEPGKIDFRAYAESAGVPGHRVTDPAGAGTAVGAAAGQTALVCVPETGPARPSVTVHAPAAQAAGESADLAGTGGTLADSLVTALVAGGVERIYGKPRGPLSVLADRWTARGNRAPADVASVESGSMMASAVAKWTGAPVACVAADGPDLVLQLNGLYDARYDHAPVVVISAPDPHGVVDGIELLADVATVQVRFDGSADAHRAVRDALTRCVVERTVVQIEVDPARLTDPVGPRAADSVLVPVVTEAALPPAEVLEEAVRALAGARRCAVLLGRGATGASAEVDQLVRLLHAPVVTTMPGRGVLGDEHPHMAGGIGSSGHRSALSTLEKCDAVLMLGVSARGAAFEMPDGCFSVRVDADPVALSAGAGIILCGTVRETAEALVSRMSDQDTLGRDQTAAADREAFLQARRQQYSVFREKPPRPARKGRPIQPSTIPQTLSRVLADVPQPPVVTVDVGLVTMWVYRFLNGRHDFVWTSSFATMGFAVPAAIAISEVSQGRPAVATVGDGGCAMIMSELATAAATKVPVVVVVFNNGKLGAIKYEQEIMGWPEYGSALVNGDLSGYARACGINAKRITDPAELEPAMREALASGEPYLLDVVCDPHEIPKPPKSRGTFRQSIGFFLAFGREGVRHLRGGSSEDGPLRGRVRTGQR